MPYIIQNLLYNKFDAKCNAFSYEICSGNPFSCISKLYTGHLINCNNITIYFQLSSLPCQIKQWEMQIHKENVGLL